MRDIRVRSMRFETVMDPCMGLLIVRMMAGTAVPEQPPLHDPTFITFNPLLDLPSLGERVSSLLSAYFGVDRRRSDPIGLQAATAALDELDGDSRYGLEGEVVLEAVYHEVGGDQIERTLGNLGLKEEVVFDGEDGGETCSVCLEGFCKGAVITPLTPCSHRFHSKCILQWLKRSQTCPLCRSTIHFIHY